MLNNLADEIEVNDIGAALKRFYSENELNRQVLLSLDYNTRITLAKDFRNTKFLKTAGPNYLVFIIDSKTIGVIRDKFGNWIIYFW